MSEKPKKEVKSSSETPEEKLQSYDDQNEEEGDGYVEASMLAVEKKVLKRKIVQNQVNRLHPSNKDNEPQYQSSAGEYHSINMDLAINFVLTKGKAVKEKIEAEKLSNQYIEENLLSNRHFIICYNSFLQKLINKKLMTADFKNVKQKILEKLEGFFVERIDKSMESLKIQNEYQLKALEISTEFDRRIEELKNKIKQKEKIIAD